ncbi:HK97 family phage prohead protease, partial [Hyalangium sp.]|uniref:HK97 family phage prohead protease n=1 Tax=Hyalangium sp. TaxID=2028555 RepID=UPI002D3D5EFF
MRPQRQPTTPLPPEGTAKALGFLELTKAEGAVAASAPVFRITSEVLDRVHDRVMGDGAKVENFNRNPILLWNHDSWTPAIGTAKVYRDAAGQWLMEPAFDNIGELSKEIAAKVAAGTLRTCSIRFKYLKHAYNDSGGLDVLEWELLEVSITNIPCNPEAERVKNANTNPKQKNDNPTPAPEETPAKALE